MTVKFWVCVWLPGVSKGILLQEGLFTAEALPSAGQVPRGHTCAGQELLTARSCAGNGCCADGRLSRPVAGHGLA